MKNLFALIMIFGYSSFAMDNDEIPEKSKDIVLEYIQAGNQYITIRHIAKSTDSSRFATSDSKNRVMLWDCQSGRYLGWFAIYSEPVYSLAFNQSGTSLIINGKENNLTAN